MPKLKIAVFVSGSGSNLQALIDAVNAGIIKGQIEIVISDRPDAYALQRAEEQGIPALCIDKKARRDEASFGLQLMSCLASVKPDLIILAGFLSILPSKFVEEYQGKIINIHPSLIPAFCGKGYYGEKVHRGVIEYGVKISGATVHFVDENTDTGPIILQQAVEVTADDTPETLAKKILPIEHKLIVKAAELFCDKRLQLDGRKVKIRGVIK
ncbi:MAG: phosphoribosylglycinamide formyltransferase [Clostridiales bacterium GWB2_37_7]|nr:MAG: phosphoribosylglycinamide formyltransferase [Clostridiales bacterium GWB2_37_7]